MQLAADLDSALSRVIFFCRLGQVDDLVARQPKDGPFVHRFRAQSPVELDGRLVPIEHGPLHPAAATITGNVRQMHEQSAAITFAALLWLNEQIFEIKPRTA